MASSSSFPVPNPSVKHEFVRMKTVFFVACSKGQWIGRDWTLKPDQAEAAPMQEVFDRVIEFLQKSQISTRNHLTESEATQFRNLMVTYTAQILPGNGGELDLASTQKLKAITRLLRNQHSSVSTQNLLSEKTISLKQKIHLKRLISLLDFESAALQSVLNCFDDSLFFESLLQLS